MLHVRFGECRDSTVKVWSLDVRARDFRPGAEAKTCSQKFLQWKRYSLVAQTSEPERTLSDLIWRCIFVQRTKPNC